MNKIKIENGSEKVYEVDVARERFESALNELLNKADAPYSESDNESIPETKERIPFMDDGLVFDNISEGTVHSILPHRPFKKKRRKENESKETGFHHTYVMRMFDRSVDLAQFGETAPLYPICRAWMLNQPLKSEPKLNSIFESSNSNDIDTCDTVNDNGIQHLPSAAPWQQTKDGSDPRVPKPRSFPIKQLDNANEGLHLSPATLLIEHLHRWRVIREDWKVSGQAADRRYQESVDILRDMFDQ